jgi:hypothetical protein
VISIHDNKAIQKAPYVTMGLVTVTYGTCIYYLLPLALISSSFALILDILFLQLIGLLFGLTLLASNLQGILQWILCRILLFWETASMKILINKNLVSHKTRNKLTAIIFSLTLGTVIFILTTVSI